MHLLISHLQNKWWILIPALFILILAVSMKPLVVDKQEYASDLINIATSFCTTSLATCTAECAGGVNTAANCEGTDWFPLCNCQGAEKKEIILVHTSEKQSEHIAQLEQFLATLESEPAKNIRSELKSLIRNIEAEQVKAYIRRVNRINELKKSLPRVEAEAIDEFLTQF